MRFNFKKLAITLALITAAPNVDALGLGEIKLNSLLNRPLDARIELLDVGELSPSEILVSLANEEDFERVGVENVVFLSDLQFKVVTGQGKPYVRISSSRPVVEPFLNFVVQARWPSGRLLREYTVLMDLPAFADNKVTPVITAPTRQRAVSVPQPINRQTVRPQASVAAPAPSRTSYQGETYRVQRGDTLSQIAREVRPGDASVNQTMVALQQLNPDAFINGNINLLKRGRVLRVPTTQDLAGISRSQANQVVKEAVREFTSTASQLDATAATPGGQSASGAKSGRVKVLSGVADGSGSSGSGSAEQGARVEALERNLNNALEQLDKTESENEELRAKLASLQSQLDAQEKLVEISNESLQSLEQNAAKLEADRIAAEQKLAEAAREAEAEAEAAAEKLAADADDALAAAEDTATDLSEAAVDLESVDDSEISADIKAALKGDPIAEVDSDSGVDEESDAPADSEALVDTTEVAEPTPTARPIVVPPVVQEEGIVDKLLANIFLIGGALLALILGIVGFLFLRNRRNDEDEYDFDDDEEFIDEPLPLEDEDDAIVEDDTVIMPHLAEEGATEALNDTPEEDDDDFETDDIVTEADIWIAYGKYDEAEEKLVKALRKEPLNNDVRLKLMEVYAAQGKGDEFDSQFAKLSAIAAPALIDRGGELRGSITGLNEFDASQFDVSDVLAANEAPAEPEVEAEPSPVMADDDLDLSEFDDLDLDVMAEEDDDVESVADEDAFADSDDLGLDDDVELELDIEESDSGFEAASEGGDDLDDIEFAPALDLDEGSTQTHESITADNSDDLDLDIAPAVGLDGLDDLADLDSLDIDDSLATSLDDSTNSSLDFAALDEELKSDSADDTSDAPLSGVLDSADDLDLDDLDFDTNDSVVGDLDAQLEAEQPSESIDSLESVSSEMDDDLADIDTLSMESELDDLELDTLKDQSQTDTPEISADSDELDALGDDMDLASLDSELDALTADLDTDLEDIDSALDIDAPTLGADDDIPSLTDSASSAIDEPVTDLDSLDAASDADDDLGDMGEETMFNQAISEVPASDMDLSVPDIDPESDDDSDLSFLSGSDQIATKLDLARAYIDMGDNDGANEILDEIMNEGNDAQKQEAIALRERLA